MKKLMLLPLLVGVVWVCSASPTVQFSENATHLVTECTISSDLLKQVFEAASEGYKAEYGIIVLLNELQTGYDDGTVSVNEIDSDTWEVIYFGNPLIVGSEDFL
jgi:hypothetical protein